MSRPLGEIVFPPCASTTRHDIKINGGNKSERGLGARVGMRKKTVGGGSRSRRGKTVCKEGRS